MATCSTNQSTSTRLTPQQHSDLLLEVINQLGSLNKKVDVVWNHVVNKLEGSRVDSPSTKDDVYGDESHMPTFTLFLGFHLMPKLYNGGHNFAPRPETFMN